MKMKTLSVLAGVGAPLIATATASAGFLGIKDASKENSFGLLVCNVYAEFDRPGEDFMIAGAGTANAPLLVQVIGGTFYNHSFGSNTAPSTAAIAAYPSLAFDSFVTIGAKVTSGDFPDATVETPGMPQIEGTQFTTTAGGWAVTPLDPQGDPFNSDYGGPGNGQILIAQFSTADGIAIVGTFLIQYVNNGIGAESIVSFVHIPTPGALALMGVAGLIGTRRRRRQRRV